MQRCEFNRHEFTRIELARIARIKKALIWAKALSITSSARRLKPTAMKKKIIERGKNSLPSALADGCYIKG
jgi:hypothetical protein